MGWEEGVDAFCTYCQHLRSDHKKDLRLTQGRLCYSHGAEALVLDVAGLCQQHTSTQDFTHSLQMCSDIDWDMQMANKPTKR